MDGNSVLEEGEDYTLSGDLTAANAGKYALTITGNNRYTGQAEVEYRVSKAEQTVKAELVKLEIETGETADVRVSGKGEIQYHSEDVGIALVDEKGQMTGVSEGTAVITIIARG